MHWTFPTGVGTVVARPPPIVHLPKCWARIELAQLISSTFLGLLNSRWLSLIVQGRTDLLEFHHRLTELDDISFVERWMG